MYTIAINVSMQKEYFEIDISGNAVEFASFTNYLSKRPTDIFPLKSKPNAYFPKSMKSLSTELLEQSDGLIAVQIVNNDFRIIGDSQAFLKLVDFLESLPNLSPGEHFHLDWFSNESLLAPSTSNMSFIFFMEK